MKSIIYTGPQTLKYVDVPKPKIKANEVLLKIKSAGICGTDLHIYNGGMDLPTPVTMGHEFSGVVAEVGSQVKNFKIGDRAVGEHIINCGKCHYCVSGRPNLCSNAKIIGLQLPGALTEYLAIPANIVYKLPASLSFEEGVLIEPVSIAYYAVQKAGFLLDKKVAVVGQGPIGLLVDQILQQSGATVIGIDIADWRLKFARSKKWADYVINNQKQDLTKVLSRLAPEGVDLVFEAVGQASTAELSLEIARRGGEVFLLGVFETPSKINLMNIVKKELNVHGSWTCALSFLPSLELAASKKLDLKSLITHRYAAKNGIKAFKEAASYQGQRIKTIINF
jgi:2-desacetyl-2-hydroxyethyl bacteriochlorophyllide A dehydrogenase